MLQSSPGACVDSSGHAWPGGAAAAAAAARSRPATTSGRTSDWGAPSPSSAASRLRAQYRHGADSGSGHSRGSRLAQTHQPRQRRHSAQSQRRSAPTAEHLETAPDPVLAPDTGQLLDEYPESPPEEHAEPVNGQLRHHTDSPTDVPASHREDINGSQASHDQGSLGNGAASSTADPSSPSHVQPGHAPQQGGDGSEPDWQPDWDRFEPFASMSSSADSVDLAEEVELTHPPSEHGPRFKVRMGSDSLPWDAEFRPHEYLSAEDVDLALSPQRMQAVTSDAQVWRTEAWALIQVAPSVRIRHGHGQEMGMFGLPLPRGGPFIIGSADDQDCDLIIDSPSVAPRHLRLELITCGARGRVARMTATQIAPPEHLTWVNHQLMLHGRETEARSHNLITVGDPDIAFQVVPLQSVDSRAWARRTAQRYLARPRAEEEEPLRAAIAGNPLDARSWALLGQREFKAARAGRGGSYAAARTFMRVAATILTTEALRRSTSSSSEAAPQLPSHGAGPGTFAGPLSALTIPLGSLRRGGSACQKLAEHLAEWGHMELSNGLQDSARRLWRRAVEVCKPPTKAAFAGSTAMQVLVAWTRLELREGNLRVVRLKLQEPALCVVQSIMVSMLLRELAAVVPDAPSVLELKAELAYAGRGVRKARSTYAAALTASYGDPALVIRWVRREVAAGHLRHALRIVESALVRHPGHPDLEQMRHSITHTPPEERPGQAKQAEPPQTDQRQARLQQDLPAAALSQTVVEAEALANRGSDEAHDSHQPRDEDAVSEREASGGSGILERAHVRSLHGREWATLSEQQRPDRQRQERLRQLKSGRAFGGM